MSNDREVLLRAIRDTDNLREAARALGVSRRTLQNRMRAAGLARGKAGRPKRRLAYGRKTRGWGVAAVAAVAGVAAGALLLRKGSST